MTVPRRLRVVEPCAVDNQVHRASAREALHLDDGPVHVAGEPSFTKHRRCPLCVPVHLVVSHRDDVHTDGRATSCASQQCRQPVNGGIGGDLAHGRPLIASELRRRHTTACRREAHDAGVHDGAATGRRCHC